MSLVLIGDMGGTHARLAIARPYASGHIAIESCIRRPGDDFPAFPGAIETCLSDIDQRLKAVSPSIAERAGV